MIKVVFILFMIWTSAVWADGANLEGRDSVIFGHLVYNLGFAEDMHWGAKPISPSNFFNQVFVEKTCEAPNSPLKSGTLRMTAGHIFCHSSDRGIWDYSCTVENTKKTRKTTQVGEAAYALITLLKEGNAPVFPDKAGAGTGIGVGSVECTYEGFQSCTGVSKAGDCVFR